MSRAIRGCAHHNEIQSVEGAALLQSLAAGTREMRVLPMHSRGHILRTPAWISDISGVMGSSTSGLSVMVLIIAGYQVVRQGGCPSGGGKRVGQLTHQIGRAHV